MGADMKTFDDFHTLIAAERDRRDNYKTLASCVLPRPIAFVSTISADGVPNLAPFSFFNAVGVNPPAVMFAPAIKRDGSPKDTVVNLGQVPQCVVNVVPYAIREAMNETSYPFGPEVDEFTASGFTPIPSRFVKPFRVAESPIQMESKLLQIVPLGEGPLSANICICQVLCFHIAAAHLLPNGTADAGKIDLVGRLGGEGYTTTRDRFTLPNPDPNR